LLKIKAFILEKFLDTAFQRLIRFFPESSDGVLNLRWNYSPLKERPPSCRAAFLLFLARAQIACEFRFGNQFSHRFTSSSDIVECTDLDAVYDAVFSGEAPGIDEPLCP
jgi:hypothetical protein